MEKTDNELEILETSKELFLKNGYIKTTIRQITSMCDVSVGLIDYHFKSKFMLAVKCIESIFADIKKSIYKYVDFEQQPLLYYAVYIRYCNMVFMDAKYLKFYLESLKEGIYSFFVYNSNIETMQKIAEKYDIEVDYDYLLLYSNYIPVEIEKILVLNKMEGQFKTISYEKIPEIIFNNTFEHFIDDKDLLEKYVEESIQICKSIQVDEDSLI